MFKKCNLIFVLKNIDLFEKLINTLYTIIKATDFISLNIELGDLR